MKIILQAQITEDGYIARKDSLREWYLKPELFGISEFFDNASAILYYEYGQCVIVTGQEEISVEPSLLKEKLSSLETLPGYIALEASPQSAPILKTLMSSHCIAEIRLIHIPVKLHRGIPFPISELNSNWQQTNIKASERDSRVLFSTYCKKKDLSVIK